MTNPMTDRGTEIERVALTPAFAAMNGRDKWETLVLSGLIGTDEPWIEAMTTTLRQEAAAISAMSSEDEVRRLREALTKIAQDDYDPIGESFTEAAAQIARTALTPNPCGQGDGG